MNPSPPLVPLTGADDPGICGGKAAALARSAAAGLPVPDGLVIPAGLRDADLADSVLQIIDWAQGRAPYGLIARSSATVEDGSVASFAGQYRSIFTPAAPVPLQQAVRDVRASVRSPGAGEYARARGATAEASMAVLIQPAIRPHTAGVLAAEHTHGRTVQWQIQAVRGLAEPLASGQCTAELHDSRQSPTAAPSTAEQPIILLPGASDELQQPPGEWLTLTDRHGRHVPTKVKFSSSSLLQLYCPAEWTGQPILAESDRTRIIDLARTAAAALRLNQIDIEWALTTDGALYLIQARRLTSPIPAQASRLSSGQKLHGIPAAPGTASGPALQLADDTDPDAARTAARGAVLICGNLGPESAHALLGRPAAIVSTCGGPLSHAAIVARELGVPCITAIDGPIHAMPNGTMLHVDATAGTVAITAQEPVRAAPRPSAADTAIVTDRLSTPPPHDGRAATLLLHLPHARDSRTVGDLLDGTFPGPAAAPVGALQPAVEPPFPAIPSGYSEHLLPGLGRLLWPTNAGRIPTRLAVLDPTGHVIHQRTITPPTKT